MVCAKSNINKKKKSDLNDILFETFCLSYNINHIVSEELDYKKIKVSSCIVLISNAWKKATSVIT